MKGYHTLCGCLFLLGAGLHSWSMMKHSWRVSFHAWCHPAFFEHKKTPLWIFFHAQHCLSITRHPSRVSLYIHHPPVLSNAYQTQKHILVDVFLYSVCFLHSPRHAEHKVTFMLMCFHIWHLSYAFNCNEERFSPPH